MNILPLIINSREGGKTFEKVLVPYYAKRLPALQAKYFFQAVLLANVLYLCIEIFQ